MKLTIYLVLLVAAFKACYAVETCPDVKFVENFNDKRFLGKWYGIQTTGIDMACGSYEVFDTENPEISRILLHPANVNIQITRKAKNFSEGYTTSSTIELLNNSNMRVILTDYDNYAVVVECKNLGGPIYLSTTIGSRTKTLDNSLIEKLKQQITSIYKIDLSGIKVIDQSSC